MHADAVLVDGLMWTQEDANLVSDEANFDAGHALPRTFVSASAAPRVLTVSSFSQFEAVDRS
jgi:hypothetical protein